MPPVSSAPSARPVERDGVPVDLRKHRERERETPRPDYKVQQAIIVIIQNLQRGEKEGDEDWVENKKACHRTIICYGIYPIKDTVMQ